MATWWKPWTWWPGASHGDNFIRHLPNGWTEGAKRYGLPINADTALQLAAVLCAVRVIAEGVAQQPLKVMIEEERDGKTYRRPAVENPAHRLLHRAPNGWQTSFEWRELMTTHAVLTGNAYSVIGRVNGRIDELIPVHPSLMQVRFENGAISYRATINGKQVDLLATDVFHLRGPSMDGVLGMPIVQLARDVLGLASALEHAQLELQSKGGRPAGVLTTEQALDPAVKEDLRDEWRSKFGPDGEGGVAILDKGWTFIQMALNAVDQQFIENRRFQIEEIGRVFRVLPLMMMQADKAATYASSEQFFQAHDVHTLHPWTQRWEQTIDRDLLDDDRTYANFSMQGLMRAAAADRAEYYARALGAPGSRGWMTQNEVRAFEDMDPHPDGDELNVAAPTPAEGGGPNADLPFEAGNGADEGKAYRESQPRGPDGRWMSMGSRLVEILGLAGRPGRPTVMSLGRVRRPSAIAAIVGEPAKGFRYTLSNHAVQHSRARHPNLTDADFAALPAILKDATDMRPGRRGKQGEKRFQIVHRHDGVTYGVIAQVNRHRRWLSVVTFYRT